MKIIRLKTLTGPNIWSVSHKNLIVATIDPIDSETNIQDKVALLKQHFYKNFSLINVLHVAQIEGFAATKHECAVTLVKYAEVIASGLQTLAGMPSVYSMCWPDKQTGFVDLVFSYEIERAGEYAAKAAIEIVEKLLNGERCALEPYAKVLRLIRIEDKAGPSIQSIMDEAKRRDIPVIKLHNNSFIQLGHGIHLKKIHTTIASTTSCIAVELAGNKQNTKNMLRLARVPVPNGGVASTEDELKILVQQSGFPLVIKPVDGGHDKFVTTNINSWDDALNAFNATKAISEEVICERFVKGVCFRVLVINYKFVAAAMLEATYVKGTGLHTIQQLVDRINCDRRRGDGYGNVMTEIKVDEHTLGLLAAKGYTPSTKLPMGEVCYLKSDANLSAGGIATNVTQKVHPKNIELFNRIARAIGLDICGIDVVANDLSKPISDNGGSIIDVNAAPGFHMHLHPSNGGGINVAAPVIDMLFPGKSKGRVPIIAVSGTNGKTTTTCLAAHICRQQGLVTGFTTTSGIYIQKEQVMEGDCTGPGSAEILLKDPSIEVAVFECARGGILRKGLGFDYCDVAIVTNIAEDHLGLNGIDTLEELAQVKAIVVKSVRQNGYAVLNADDELVYKMHRQLSCNIALFSLDANNLRIKKHVSEGGVAAVCENGLLVVYKNQSRQVVCKVNHVPITFDGLAEFNIANVLCALLAAFVQGCSIESIKGALHTFSTSPEHTPGRLTLFEFNDFRLMVDYAHNPHGIKALGKFVCNYTKASKVGIIAGDGDRRDSDLVALGKEAALIFDEIIIRMADDRRGRTVEQIFKLINQGIQSVKAGMPVKLVADETEAVRMAINNSQPGSFVVLLVDNVTRALTMVKEAHNKQQKSKTMPFELEAFR